MTPPKPSGHPPATYLIGVDTGGTYTDAAIIEARGHRVIATAKAITTKGDLAIGVTEAITLAVAKLPQGLRPEDIAMVSVSTTLATNAVVEGHGSVRIAHGDVTQVFEFGPRDHFVIPSWHTASLRSAPGCVLFSFSDRPVHQALGIHREERLS